MKESLFSQRLYALHNFFQSHERKEVRKIWRGRKEKGEGGRVFFRPFPLMCAHERKEARKICVHA